MIPDIAGSIRDSIWERRKSMWTTVSVVPAETWTLTQIGYTWSTWKDIYVKTTLGPDDPYPHHKTSKTKLLKERQTATATASGSIETGRSIGSVSPEAVACPPSLGINCIDREAELAVEPRSPDAFNESTGGWRMPSLPAPAEPSKTAIDPEATVIVTYTDVITKHEPATLTVAEASGNSPLLPSGQ